MQKESFVEKVVFRLVRKHIAGPTMSSAIGKAKQFNARGLPVSITFISREPKDSTKANYIANTYMQLIRELKRMGLSACIHMPLEQIGSSLSEDVCNKNMDAINALSSKHNIFTWFEVHDLYKEYNFINAIANRTDVGLAFSDVTNALKFIKKNRKARSIKVMCNGENVKHDLKYVDKIKQILDSSKSTVLLSLGDKDIDKLLKVWPKYKKSLIFEFQLGYSSKKINRLLKKGARLSMHIPFGKDWASYAANNVPEGYMRKLASNLLNSE